MHMLINFNNNTQGQFALSLDKVPITLNYLKNYIPPFVLIYMYLLLK